MLSIDEAFEPGSGGRGGVGGMVGVGVGWVVVAVGVVQAGNDFEQLEPGVDRVEDNLKETPKEVVTDGGYVSKDTIVAMKERAIEYIAPCVDEAGKGQSS